MTFTAIRYNHLAAPGGVPATLAPVEVYWARAEDGSYAFRALANPRITSVRYAVDGVSLGGVARTTGDNFPMAYTFASAGNERRLVVTGFDAQNKAIAEGNGSMDVTPDTAVYVKQMGHGLYEAGLERAPSGVAAVEVRADGVLLTDGVSNLQRTPRLAVRSQFTSLGLRHFTITTFGADGAARGTLERSIELL